MQKENLSTMPLDILNLICPFLDKDDLVSLMLTEKALFNKVPLCSSVTITIDECIEILQKLFVSSNLGSIGEPGTFVITANGRLLRFYYYRGSMYSHELKFGGKVRSVAQGENHALILMRDGRVFGGGFNHSGQLGLDNSEVISTFAFQRTDKIDFLPIGMPGKVKEIAACYNHSIFLMQDDSLYWCGNTDSSGLSGYPRGSKPVLNRIPCHISIKKIVTCGKTYFLTHDNMVYIWRHDNENIEVLNIINEPIKDIFVNCSFSLVLTCSGSLYEIGNGLQLIATNLKKVHLSHYICILLLHNGSLLILEPVVSGYKTIEISASLLPTESCEIKDIFSIYGSVYLQMGNGTFWRQNISELCLKLNRSFERIDLGVFKWSGIEKMVALVQQRKLLNKLVPPDKKWDLFPESP